MVFNPLQTVPENQLLFNNVQQQSSSLAHSIITPSKASTTTDNNNYQSSSNQFNSLPFDPLMTSSMSIKEEEEEVEDETTFPSSSLFDSKSCSKQTVTPPAVKQVNYDVWDLVPGQPNLSGGNNNPAAAAAAAPSSSFVNCDSSSGISSSSSNNGKAVTASKQADSSSVNWLDQVSELISKSDSESAAVAVPSTGLLDDPFDADWAALATRSFEKTTKNPFVDTDKCTVNNGTEGVQIKKAFELQM